MILNGYVRMHHIMDRIRRLIIQRYSYIKTKSEKNTVLQIISIHVYFIPRMNTA